MRDLVLREALKVMARDASKRLRELVAEGEELPYDVHEAEAGSPLPQYIPLTERFIRDHSQALCALDSFGAACAAVDSAELAGPYLESFGIGVPRDGRKRGELAGVVFLCGLWAGSTDFSVDDARLGTAIAELEAGGEIADDEIEVIVPLRGLQMPVTRLELATATIVRADAVDVPPEARAPEGSGAAGWEPTFLAATRVSESDVADGPSIDAGARAVEAFRQLVTTLRLFKSGGVGLGPYAWTRAGEHRWRRIATGAGRPRAGGYRLGEEELTDLAVFSRTLAFRSTAFGRPAKSEPGLSGALARAISRFEAGLERAVVIDALNDYLLTLRFVLEGGGAAQLGLAIRVAALCAEPEDRGETKAVIDRAVSLERELWSGEPAQSGNGSATPAQTAAAVEDLTRAILRDAACGHLGTDLRSTADEILLADGLAVGEGRAEQRGGVEEWDAGQDEAPDETREMSLEELEAELNEAPSESEPQTREDPAPKNEPEPQMPDPARVVPEQNTLWMDALAEWQEVRREPDERMQVPEPRGRIRVESRPRSEEETVSRTEDHAPREVQPRTVGEADQATHSRVAELLEERPDGRHRTSERVAYLFPRPETTEWNVREIDYDRRRRAQVRAS
ncbi:MAG TPA: hypothetical protein VKA47_03935 [Solirubrobacterales bacterium]|nr:hypothetical protein [Solirubrobacterales bacterium]